nr:exosome complex component CSL4 isoform X2 [Equus asinus]
MAPPVRYCVPGERLCNLEEGSPGSGTYTRHGYIFSSLAGCLTKSSENGALPVVSVMRETESQLLPDVGAIVTCKVSSINSRFAKVHILYVGSTPLKNSFRGTIRKEDVRATEKDKVVGWFFFSMALGISVLLNYSSEFQSSIGMCGPRKFKVFPTGRLKFTRVSAQVTLSWPK